MLRLAVAALSLLAADGLAGPRQSPLSWDSETQEAGTQEFQLGTLARLVRRVETVQQGYSAFDSSLLFVRGMTGSGELFAGVLAGIENTGVTDHSIDPRFVLGWHHRLLSPRDVLGLSLAASGLFGPERADFELTAATDRVLGPVTLVLNLGLVPTVKWKAGLAGPSLRLVQSLSGRYRLKNGFSTGVEVLVRETFVGKAFEGTAVYAGPALAMERASWWASFGLYAQVAADKAAEDRGLKDPLEVRFNERFWMRLTVAAKVK